MKTAITILVSIILVAGVSYAAYNYVYLPNVVLNQDKNLVGSDRDAHGCIGSAGYSWCQAKQKCLRIWEESCEQSSYLPGPSPADVEITFVKTGNLVLRSGEWVLIHEAPGQPALTALLKFNLASVCDVADMGLIACSPADFENGERVSVEGVLGADGVTVVKMTAVK